MYKKIDNSQSFVDREKEVAKLWNDNDIIQKNFDMNKEGEYFTFYDGPPTANGKPHVGHVLTRVMKDIIPRYKVMKGYKVLRKAGWDTHGLPVELEIEKKLGISGKEQIEAYGVEKFIKECKESVFKYTSLWKDMSEKLGFWVDMDNPYVTYHDNYIESVWWALKQMWDKELLYQGHKVMPYCPRCGTALSSHEVAQGYKDVKEATAVVKFKVKGEENKYFLAWTTTPWTLPSNMALTVNKKYDYVEAEQKGEIYILAKDLAKNILGEEYTVVREFKGEELLGMEYEQMFKFETPKEKAFFVIHGDFVTLTDGTGIVHTAPAYGEDDNRVCKQNNVPSINLVDKSGCFVESVEPWKGMFVKKADEKIIEYMEEKGILYKSEKHTHSYPHCWRCDTPLLYYPKDSWFVRTTKVKDRLIENNNSINWLPDNIRTGRMGKFLENNIDWGISRDRYWGTPLPIWQCECGHQECIGSRKELVEKGVDVNENMELHKPYIDEVKLTCPHCGKLMTRTKEVIDCWFDSGSMPFAQHHYPFENKEVFEENFPAQFISEAVDQTRGWFYTLQAISTTLFDKAPFENCIVLGHVLDKKGIKMSKHKGNVVDPFDVLEHEGADAARWHFYTASAPWLPTRFSEDDVAETGRRFLGTLWNVYSFYVLYADIDKFNPYNYKDFVSENVMDKWIISKLYSLNKSIDGHLNNYEITQAAVEIEEFVDELSNWYVRRNRARFWQDTLTEDKIGAYVTLHKVLVELCKIAAPFVPFITEEIYQNLVVNLDKSAEESIHLCNWPQCKEEFINKSLEKEMDLAYKVVKLGRAARNSANIKNRQPLSKMLLSTNVIPEYYGDIIKDELNIKEIQFGADVSKYVSFEIKPNLPVLGKTYGKLIPEIKKAISAENQMNLASKISSGESVVVNAAGQDIELNSENLLVNMKGLDGYAFSGEGDIGVLLDTNITEELREEGHLREILSKVQNMRKESGFQVDDRINMYISGNNMLEDIIRKYEDPIKKETLTVNILFDEESDYKEIKINGETLNLNVEVVK